MNKPARLKATTKLLSWKYKRINEKKKELDNSIGFKKGSQNHKLAIYKLRKITVVDLTWRSPKLINI